MAICIARGDLQRLQSLQTLLGEVELAVSKLGFDHPHTIYLSDIFGSERLTNEGHLHLHRIFVAVLTNAMTLKAKVDFTTR